MTREQNVSEKLLQAAFHERVRREMGALFQQMSALTKGMDQNEAKDAKLLLLDLMASAATEFINVMTDRVNKKQVQPE